MSFTFANVADKSVARLKSETEFNLNIYNYPLNKYMEAATAIVKT